MSSRSLCLLASLALSMLWVSPGSAEWKDQGPVFVIVEENDLFVNTDRHYTQGFRNSFLQADDDVPGWALWLSRSIPRAGFGDGPNKFGYQIGQSIFTPANLFATGLLTHDRPYAGWLYTGLILQRRGMMDDRWPVLENFQLDIGIIGPDAFAKETQTWVHDLRGFATPRGWQNQLHDEPGIALKYQRSWLFSPTASGPRWIDLIPHTGMSLGNVETSFRIGGTLRVGFNLPDDFGVSTISSLTTTEGGWSRSRTGRPWGAYVFAGTEASTVLYTAFLDGNLYRHSHHVQKEPFVGEWKAGVGFLMHHVELAFTYVYRTPQFVLQGTNDSYGSVSLKIKF